MQNYKKYLTEKLQNFFESIESSLMAVIGYKDSTHQSDKVIKIDSTNYYEKNDEEFKTEPDFIVGFTLVEKRDTSLNIIMKVNLTKIASTVKLTLDETKEEVKDFITKALYYFDVRVAHQDFRGYYKFNKFLNETVETQGEVYESFEMLIDLKESTSTDETTGRVNAKGSAGLKLGKEAPKLSKDQENPEDYEPTDQDVVGAQSELEPVD